jgi:hypothetical protein
MLTSIMQRIEPFGWDSNDRTYFLLDDNRLYRRTDPPPPPVAKTAKPKKNSKKAKAALRASKRRKVSEAIESDVEPAEEAEAEAEDLGSREKEDDRFGGMKWECIAVTFDEVHAFVESIEKSRDPNERVLLKRIKDDLLPLLEKQEESRKRKAAQKERELLNMEKLATAKRSSRIAGRMEQVKAEEEAREADRKKQADLAMAKKEQEKWTKLEKERESRMMTREQRLKEREARRILHEDELANLSEDSKKIDSGEARLSERHLKAEIEKKKLALEELAEEDDWIFDCICGAYGQIDDGTHSIACEKCNIWQHSKCLKVSQAEAERDDFHFICSTCQRRARDAERAKTYPPIKITLKRPGSSSSPTQSKINGSADLNLSPKVSNGSIQNIQNYQGSPLKAPALPAYYGQQQPVTWQSPYSSQQDPVPVSQTTSNDPSSMPQIPSLPRPPSSHALSSSRVEGPTSPPLPVQNQTYSHPNGSASNYSNNMSNVPTPNQAQHVSPYAPIRVSNGGTPAPRIMNGSQHISSDGRRNSMTFSSPTPVLTPVYKPTQPVNYAGSPTIHSTPDVKPKSFVPHTVPSPHLTPSQEVHDPTHVLPPVATGYSPTKHSPPRPTTSNGSFGSATPSILPPVASLSPSPLLQNLTPPVKASEPREYGQNIGPPLG